MIKKVLGLAILVVCFFVFLHAQDRKAPRKKDLTAYHIQLGNRTEDTSFVTKSQFDSLIENAVYLRDSLGHYYIATAFEVIYSEWGIFEDHTGREKIMTEYYSSNVLGSELPDYFKEQLKSSAKLGDTLMIQNVWAEKKDETGTTTILKGVAPRKYIINRKK